MIGQLTVTPHGFGPLKWFECGLQPPRSERLKFEMEEMDLRKMEVTKPRVWKDVGLSRDNRTICAEMGCLV